MCVWAYYWTNFSIFCSAVGLYVVEVYLREWGLYSEFDGYRYVL